MKLYEQERYDPAVDVIPRKEFKAKWLNDELEPCLFVLKHPVELKSKQRSYYLAAGTVIQVVGAAEKEERASDKD